MKTLIILICTSFLFYGCSTGESKDLNNEIITSEQISSRSTNCDHFSESTIFLDNVSQNTMKKQITYPKGKAQITNKLAVWKSGFETGIHKHPVPIVVTVWQGELTVELLDEGKTIVTKAGESYVSTPNIWHNSSNQSDKPLAFSSVFLGNDELDNTVKKD